MNVSLFDMDIQLHWTETDHMHLFSSDYRIHANFHHLSTGGLLKESTITRKK